MIPTKIYSFVIPAGGAFQVQVIGDYFKIASAYGAVEVRGDTFGTIGALVPGQGLRDTPFGRLEFRDLSGLRNEVSIIVAGEYFVDDRVQGTVEVIDGNKARTVAGSAFMDMEGGAIVANSYPYVQLWNPAASGRRLLVSQVWGTTVVGGHMTLVHSSVTVGPLVRNAGTKRSGGGSSIAEMRVTTDPVDYSVGPRLAVFYLQPNGNQVIAYREPILVMPGYGLLAKGAKSADLIAGFEFFEELL